MRKIRMRLSIINALAGLFAFAAAPSVALAQGQPLSCQRAVMAYGHELMVRDGSVLHGYYAYGGRWWRASADIVIPPDAEQLYFNERKMIVAHGGRLSFYEEGRQDGEDMPMPKLDAGAVVVNNAYSTERELMVVTPDHAIIYMPESRQSELREMAPARASDFQPDGGWVLARYNGVLPQQTDCLFDVLYSRLAAVSGDQVRFYQFERAGAGETAMRLKPLPEMSYAVPQDAREVLILWPAHLGVLRGHQLHFSDYDAKRGMWVDASDIPDFDLDTRASLPVSSEP